MKGTSTPDTLTPISSAGIAIDDSDHTWIRKQALSVKTTENMKIKVEQLVATAGELRNDDIVTMY